jgi:hypothetical protein
LRPSKIERATPSRVTLLHAQNHGGQFGTPRYVAYVAVFGDAHVTGEDQLYSAVRFRLDHPYWLSHLGEVAPVSSCPCKVIG